MKRTIRFFCFIILITFLIPAFACADAYSHLSFTGFNTDIYVCVKGNLSDDTKTQIKNCISALESEFSTSEPNSKVSTINSDTTSISVSTEFINVFNLSKKFHTLSNGKFNPATLPLLELWQLSPSTHVDGQFSLPSEDQINSTKALCDFNLFSLSSANTLTKTNANAKLDFGGILKGYASEKIRNILIENGFSEGYVRIGGSSLYILSISDELKIKHPKKRGEFIVSVNSTVIANTPLSTSGDYERYHEKDGVKYCHIIDANTGNPIMTGISSATVFGHSGAFTDALSTAVSCFEFEVNSPQTSPLVCFMKEITAISEYSDVKFIAVSEKNGKFIVTNLDDNLITILDSDYTLINF